MAVWISVKSIHAHGHDIDWGDGPASKAAYKKFVEGKIVAWRRQFDVLLAESKGVQLTWSEQRAVLFNEQTSYAALLAIQVSADCLEHPELPRLTDMNLVGSHPKPSHPSPRFHQLKSVMWVPADFEGVVESPSPGSGRPIHVGSSVALRRQLGELYGGLYGGTEADMVGWHAAPGDDWNAVDTQVRYALSLLGQAAKMSVEHQLPCFVG